MNNNQSKKYSILQKASQFISQISNIITTLKIRHPQSANQFTILLQSIKLFYNSVLQTITENNQKLFENTSSNKTKNIELLQKNLKILMNQMNLYFQEYNRYYSDPNLKMFQRQFDRLVESYQFRNINVDKFMVPLKYRNMGIQVGESIKEKIDNDISFGIEYQKQIQSLKNRIKQLITYGNKLEDQNNRLMDEIAAIQRARQQDNQQFMDKINKLKGLLQNVNNCKAPQLTDINHQPTYRSHPQFPNSSGMNRRSYYQNKLKDTLEQMQQIGQIQDNDTCTSRMQNQDEWRLIYLQATTIQKILDQI